MTKRGDISGCTCQSAGEAHEKTRAFAGFTTMELIMVILLLSIVGAAAVMMWPSGMKSDAALIEFKNAVRIAQHLALTRTFRDDSTLLPDPWGIYISGNKYTIRRKSGTVAKDPGGSRLLKDRSLTGGASLSCTPSNIFFDRFGVPVDSSGTPLASAASCAVDGASVTIYPETGYVE